MYHFIINPKSRSGNGYLIWRIVKKELEKRQVEYTSYFTRYEFHATNIATTICNNDENINTIVILGGDGTVNEVINGITDFSKVLLGYIPSGSSNDLARSLKIPKDPIIALDRILSAKRIKYIDNGIVTFMNDKTSRTFAVSSGIGFDAAISYEALNSNIKKVLNKIKLGKLTYLMIAIKQYIRYVPTDGELIVNGVKSYPLKNIFFVANMIHKYEGGGVMMTPDASPFDKKLSVIVIYNIPKIKALFILPSFLFGKQASFKGVQIFDCDSIEIKTKKKLIVHTDGEFAGELDHIKVESTPYQVRMIL